MLNDFKIYLEISSENLRISDFDMSFEVRKNLKFEPDSASIFVWNFDENLYQIFTKTTDEINLIYVKNDIEYRIFCGNIDSEKVGRKYFSVTENSTDIISKIPLIGLKNKIDNLQINRNYLSKISTTEILKDCSQFMGLGFISDENNLPFKDLPYAKILGSPYSIISNICKNLSLKFYIENGFLHVFLPSENRGSSSYKFSSKNSKLLRLDDTRFEIISEFTPDINFANRIECDFENLCGIFSSEEIITLGDNFCNGIKMHIILGGDYEKENS